MSLFHHMKGCCLICEKLNDQYKAHITDTRIPLKINKLLSLMTCICFSEGRSNVINTVRDGSGWICKSFMYNNVIVTKNSADETLIIKQGWFLFPNTFHSGSICYTMEFRLEHSITKHSTVFGSFGFSTKEPYTCNHAVSIVRHRWQHHHRWRHWCWHRHLCLSLLATGLNLQNSYLVHLSSSCMQIFSDSDL